MMLLLFGVASIQNENTNELNLHESFLRPLLINFLVNQTLHDHS